MKNKYTNILWILALVAIILSACGNQNTEDLLGEKTWNLISMGSKTNQNPILADSLVNLQFNFEENKIVGKASCNSYFAEIEISGDEIKISAPGSTMMYCEPEELMAQETAFLMALGEVHTFNIENGELSILYSNGFALTFK